ncbi:hypothetical protein JG688_00002704 [Phytophthora aleatoria]|uniref:RxLR effector protein n=1 Tax=Phytophthora aleatoria TaxID=2496075 RepID=A0A8J5MHP7_9STRA|nr:hypothetical protein JG688_00002704 [Phytophthora aleatoria]
MYYTSLLSIMAMVFISAISAEEMQGEAATPAPPTKFRGESHVAPPPGERQLGLWSWLFDSPTAAPAMPAPATNGYGNPYIMNNNDDDFFNQDSIL